MAYNTNQGNGGSSFWLKLKREAEIQGYWGAQNDRNLLLGREWEVKEAKLAEGQENASYAWL